MHRRYVSYSNFNISPLSIIGFIIFSAALFFIFLPLFLAALGVMAVAGAYLAWRYKKAVRDFEKNIQKRCDDDFDDYCVIDITPEKPGPAKKLLP